MSTFETLSLLIAWLALVIGLYTLSQQRKLQREANDLQRTTAELAKKQLELIAREESARTRARLALTLTGRQGAHLLLLRNVGSAAAENVTIESDGEPDVLVKHQVNSMFPFERLRPEDEIRLGAAIYVESPPKFRVRVGWTDPGGMRRSEVFELTR